MKTKSIKQTVTVNAKPEEVYELLMDAKKHSIATGASAKITTIEGSKYSAHDGYISGKNLQLIKDKLIVQSWRAQGWEKEDVDSTFIINLKAKGNDVVLEMTHANIPDQHAESINKGWHDHYWKPWKKYLKGKPIAKSPEM